MSCEPENICIGPYVVGEKPEPLEYQYLDADGNQTHDLTGYQVRFCYREQDGSPTTVVATLTNGPTAKVTHVWTGTEFPTPGHYFAQFWVGNGNSRFASQRIEFDVIAGVCAAPNI